MKTVFVGMSGGVDSSVTAAVLKQQGYKVIGVYMKNWTQDLPGFDCPWQDDFRDAKRTAVRLGIEFDVFDFEQQYRERVVDYMIDEYRAGRTPNPDIMCNQEVKFKLFLDTALKHGADMVATGHYARTDQKRLLIAKNSSKDQTYFLYRISPKALSKTLLPIGEFSSKQEVRKLANKLDLPTAEKKDSQGICFVGKVGIRDFLKQFVDTSPGPIINAEGNTIGEHEGAIFYTIGQRHGLNVGGGLPYYVTHKDMQSNTVFVNTDLSDPLLWSNKVIVRSTNWITQLISGKKYQTRLRYRGPLVDCEVEIGVNGATITLQDEQRAIAPGQSAVIYEGEVVCGGGMISEVHHRS